MLEFFITKIDSKNLLKKGEVKMIHKMLKHGLNKIDITPKLGINRKNVARYVKLPE